MGSWKNVLVLEVELRSLELGLKSVSNLADGMPSCAEPCLKQAMENAELDSESHAALQKLLQAVSDKNQSRGSTPTPPQALKEHFPIQSRQKSLQAVFRSFRIDNTLIITITIFKVLGIN
eukprot:6469231-Amphidinium_carterae.1